MSDNYCKAREEATGESETHCFHPTGNTTDRCPEECCCFCGDTFLGVVNPVKHGPHRPRAIGVSLGEVTYDTTKPKRSRKGSHGS